MYKWDCRALEVPHIHSSVYSWEILRKDLGLHLFKILLARQLKPRDHHMPHFFADWSLKQLEIDPMFYRKIVFREQSCHIWNDPENPVVKSFGAILIFSKMKLELGLRLMEIVTVPRSILFSFANMDDINSGVM